MRVLVVSALVATLIGYSTSQEMPVDHTPPIQATLSRLYHRANETIIAREKSNPGNHQSGSGNSTEANPMKVEPHSHDLDDNSVEKIRESIAAKLGNSASIKFPDIARGKAIHSLCGVVEVTGASGEARELPFVYLLQKNELYIIDGSDDRRASTAIRKMCH